MNAVAASVANSQPLAEAMLDVMNELAVVLNEELNLVKKQDVPAIQELLRRKNRLIVHYHANMKAIAAQPELLKQVTSDMRAKLKASGMRLSEATTRNSAALKAALTATQRLLQTIIDAVRREKLPQRGYTNPGAPQAMTGLYSSSCPPVAIRRTA
jgi:flagellar biosynthesis/type III secretory pathway chaperone